jgi:hypothetical protein
MKRSFCVVVLLAALTSCRDYDFQSRLTSQDGLIPADQFARYGREQAEAMAIGRDFNSAIQQSSDSGPDAQGKASTDYAKTLPDVADVQADPLGYRLTLRFRSGWRIAVNPIDDGKHGAETAGLPAKAGQKTGQ